MLLCDIDFMSMSRKGEMQSGTDAHAQGMRNTCCPRGPCIGTSQQMYDKREVL